MGRICKGFSFPTVVLDCHCITEVEGELLPKEDADEDDGDED